MKTQVTKRQKKKKKKVLQLESMEMALRSGTWIKWQKAMFPSVWEVNGKGKVRGFNTSVTSTFL